MPDIHGSFLTFVADDDLWLAELNREGRPVQGYRLSTSVGLIQSPRFAPDGQVIAYAGIDANQVDLYMIPIRGGEVKRLTYDGIIDCLGWLSSREVLVSTAARAAFRGFAELMAIDCKTGASRFLELGLANRFCQNEHAIVVGRNCLDAARWKRYQGGTAGHFWIKRSRQKKYQRLLPGIKHNVTDPALIGQRLYFVSDFEGVANIYSTDLKGTKIKRHTDHETFYVRNMATDGHRLIYQAGGDLYVHELGRDRSYLIPIEITTSATQTTPYYLSAQESLDDADISFDGSHLAAVIQGHLVMSQPWRGGGVSLDTDRAARYTNPTFSLSGKALFAAVSRYTGEEQLVRFDLVTKKSKVFAGEWGRIWSITAGDRYLAVTTNRNELWLVNSSTGARRLVDSTPFGGPSSVTFSPDKKWLVYSLPIKNRTQECLKIYNLKSQKSKVLIDPVLSDSDPAFDPTGSHLFFLGIRDFRAEYQDTHFDLTFPAARRIYAAVLDPESPDILSQHLQPTEPDLPEMKGKKQNKSKKKRRATIQFSGVNHRIVALPIKLDHYSHLNAAENKLFYLKERDELSDLWCYQLQEGKEEIFQRDVVRYQLGAGGTMIFMELTDGRHRLVPSDKPPDQENMDRDRLGGWIATEKIKTYIEPRSEWRQMYREAWLLQREHFWNDEMSRINWQAVYKKYLPLIDRVLTRHEFSDVLWEMQGELGTSHCYEFGGFYPQVPPDIITGKLGCDVKFAQGELTITKVYEGDSWIPQAASPTLNANLALKPQDRLVAVDGERIRRPDDLARLLAAKAEIPVQLEFMRKGRRRTESALVKPLANEMPLRYRHAVNQAKNFVTQMTAGRIAYLHIPDMGPQGYEEFYRQFLGARSAQGLIIDVRFNGGGHISPLILRILAQKVLGYELTRWNGIQRFPDTAFDGPIVALTNEHAGSDGDIFCHSFKLLKIGPLIGKRTWGGVIGIDNKYQLKDRGITTQPEYGFWFKDVGFAVENYGTDPDIEVEITPDDYRAGTDPHLQRAISEALRLLEVGPMEKTRFIPPNLRPPRLPKKS